MEDRVLFVDDDHHITEAFRRIFRHDPVEVLTAQSGSEALAIMESGETAVVVSDERMPGMSGSDLLAEVRRLYPSTMRMMLTGYATLDTALDMINRAEVYRFLLKPCSFVELKESVLEAIEARRVLLQRVGQREAGSPDQDGDLLVPEVPTAK